MAFGKKERKKMETASSADRKKANVISSVVDRLRPIFFASTPEDVRETYISAGYPFGRNIAPEIFDSLPAFIIDDSTEGKPKLAFKFRGVSARMFTSVGNYDAQVAFLEVALTQLMDACEPERKMILRGAVRILRAALPRMVGGLSLAGQSDHGALSKVSSGGLSLDTAPIGKVESPPGSLVESERSSTENWMQLFSGFLREYQTQFPILRDQGWSTEDIMYNLFYSSDPGVTSVSEDKKKIFSYHTAMK